MRSSIIAFFIILLSTMLLFNCTSAKKTVAPVTVANVVTSPDADLAMRSSITVGPEENYNNYCSSCHGQNMRAFVDRKWKYGKSKTDLIKSIKVGIVTEGMPAYDTTFTDQEIDALAEYILDGIKDRSRYNTTADSTPKYYESKGMRVRVDTVVNDIGIPWGIDVTADGTIFYTEREGALNIKYPDGRVQKVSNTPKVRSRNQGGMMDVALHPDYENNGWVYLSYSKMKTVGAENLGTTAVIRAKVKNGQLTDIEDIFEAMPYVNTSHHYGCRLVFSDAGYLFITVGDRGKRDLFPQSLNNSAGKVHRVHTDGSIPKTNPFVDTPDAQGSIWCIGNRNSQGLVLHPETGYLWENEHGPRGGDELNRILPGHNYGWPVASYGINYNGTTFTDITSSPEFIDPVNVWIPSIAPSGLAVVEGDKYPAWTGDILTGSLRFNYISRVRVDGDEVEEEEMILRNIGRVRSINMGADGYLYVGVENPGRILKVVPEM